MQMKYGRYEVVEELGKGQMGVVYKAHDPKIDRIIALKVLREDRVTSDTFVQRFLKEAMVIGRLSHANIVMVYDVGSDHGTVFIAEEFIEGKPFDKILKQGRLEVRDIVKYGTQMADALHYAHNKGIIHRDIKPSNIIVTLEDQVKITDFGIAHIENLNAPELTQAGEILGTPYYISPEQLMGHVIDGRSDIFSLGVMLYEMATGKRPFTGKSLASVFHEITEKVPEFPISPKDKIPDNLSEVILKTLEKNPDNRYSTGKELSEALRTITFHGQADAKPKPREKQRKFRIPLIAVLLVVLLVSGIFGYMWFFKPRATLQLQSEPEGAQVFLNGDFKGLTPLDLQVSLGKYELRLSKQNFYEWESRIEIEKEGPQPIFVQLNPLIF
jgi:eukaryotic-like serine/threonine-protein kinase